MSKVYMYGIDISTWQGNIDLTPYKGQFVIIRAGFDVTTDNKAIRNMNECDRLNIPYGVYWYSYALNVKQAEVEAEACLKVIKGRNIRVGVWFDMEDADKYKSRHGVTSASTITAMCNAFCARIEKAGYYAGIYASASWFGSKINCPKYDKWVASWGSNNGRLQNDTSSMGTLHQYTSKPLDKNVMYVPISTYAKKPKEDPKPSKTVTQLANEVIQGKWGVDDERKKRLTEAGYDYNAVQKKVNEILSKKTIDQLAKEVLAGKWGNGDERKKRLTDAGYDYAKVQAKVNDLLHQQLPDVVEVMKPLTDACKAQTSWSYKSKYEWQSKPTVPKSRTKGTCVTYVACCLQRVGLLDSGEYIWQNGRGYGDGKVYGANRFFDVIYTDNKRPADLRNKLVLGDIVLHDDNKSGVKGDGGHIEIFGGKIDKDGYATYYSGGLGSGHNTSNAFKNNRKVLAIVRPHQCRVETYVHGGTIDPWSLTLAGRDVTVHYQPDKGKKIAELWINKKQVEIGKHTTSYTFPKIWTTNVIKVVFR